MTIEQEVIKLVDAACSTHYCGRFLRSWPKERRELIRQIRKAIDSHVEDEINSNPQFDTWDE